MRESTFEGSLLCVYGVWYVRIMCVIWIVSVRLGCRFYVFSCICIPLWIFVFMYSCCGYPLLSIIIHNFWRSTLSNVFADQQRDMRLLVILPPFPIVCRNTLYKQCIHSRPTLSKTHLLFKKYWLLISDWEFLLLQLFGTIAKMCIRDRFYCVRDKDW